MRAEAHTGRDEARRPTAFGRRRCEFGSRGSRAACESVCPVRTPSSCNAVRRMRIDAAGDVGSGGAETGGSPPPRPMARLGASSAHHSGDSATRESTRVTRTLPTRHKHTGTVSDALGLALFLRAQSKKPHVSGTFAANLSTPITPSALIQSQWFLRCWVGNSYLICLMSSASLYLQY